MGYKAPDPQQFSGMEQAYSIMAPTAAILITMPSFVLAGPETTLLSRLIYMNQCNPGKIMRIGAEWLQLAEKYLSAAEMLKEETEKLGEDDWEGKDRDAFDDKSGKVMDQLQAIAAYALLVGVQLIGIASMLAVLVPAMLYCAVCMQALAIAYLGWLMVPGGFAAAFAFRRTATGYASTMGKALEAMDEAITIAGKTLAGLMTANMSISWAVLASKGNLVNPIDTIGSTGFSLLQGLSQLAARNLMSPGRGTDHHLAKVAPGLNDKIGKFSPWMQGFAGGQGVYNLGNNAAGIDDPDGENLMREAGVDVGTLDFIPNNHGFEESARGALGGDTPPEAFTMTDEQRAALEEQREREGRSG